MLRLDAIGRRYRSGTEALSDVNLAIPAGGFMALLGASGCGKSTLLRLIAGLDQPDHGRLVWAAGAAPAPGRIGMVFQDPVLLPWAGARANAALPLRLRGMGRAAAEAQVSTSLAALGLAGFEDVLPQALSGGMRMRVALARALSTTPDILLLDEPFAALDEPTRHRLQDELRAVHRARGCTVVLVTHSIYEAAYCARTVAVMTPRPGRIARVLEIAPHGGRLDAAYQQSVAAITHALEAA
jgi:NitT/TauT family transport system ATP-binding protein